MKIYVDADACPVKEFVVRVAAKFNIEVIFVASIYHMSKKEEAVTTIYVDHGYQSADMTIINLVEKNDIVITDDYGLASLLLMKSAFCLSSRGMIYSEKNIDKLIYTRHLNAAIMRGGGRIRGPVKRVKEDNQKFIESLSKVIDYSLHSPHP